jgi:hypothetical protein
MEAGGQRQKLFGGGVFFPCIHQKLSTIEETDYGESRKKRNLGET